MEQVGVVTRVRGWTRWVLLGAEDSWGATLATGPLGIYTLASFALLMHVLDLATGLRMMQLYGIELEQNPLARFMMQNAGPADLTRLSLELAARLIFLGKVTKTIDEAREVAQRKLLDGSGYQKLKQVIQAQGGNPQVLDRFELLPNATGVREISSPRGGYVSAIDAEYIGQASGMIGAGRDTKEDSIDPAVGVILEVKVGQKVESGAVLCRIYHTKEERIDEAAEMIEDAFRISGTAPEERDIILEVVG